MFFTVSVDVAGGSLFEYSTESIFEFLQAVQAFGNTDIEEVEEGFDDSFDGTADYFDDGEDYVYDEDYDCFCWYDPEFGAWYWLDEAAGEWLLVEDEDDVA